MEENNGTATKKTTGIKQLCLCFIKPDPGNSFNGSSILVRHYKYKYQSIE